SRIEIDQPTPAAPNPDHAIPLAGSADGDGTNGGIEPGYITAAGKYRDRALFHRTSFLTCAAARTAPPLPCPVVKSSATDRASPHSVGTHTTLCLVPCMARGTHATEEAA